MKKWINCIWIVGFVIGFVIGLIVLLCLLGSFRPPAQQAVTVKDTVTVCAGQYVIMDSADNVGGWESSNMAVAIRGSAYVDGVMMNGIRGVGAGVGMVTYYMNMDSLVVYPVLVNKCD